jgi:hypothetical protein
MRELLYTRLIAIPEYQNILLGDQQVANRVRVYQWGSLGQDDIPEKPEPFPFLIIFENPSTVNQEVQKTQRSQNRYFQIYGYDEHGLGYARIEHVLRLARDTVLGLETAVSPTGARCIGARWTGMSADSRDPDYNANMKFLTVVLTASQ